MTQQEGYPKLEKQPLTLVVAEFQFGQPLDLEAPTADKFKLAMADLFTEPVRQRIVQNAQFGAEGVRVSASPVLTWTSTEAGEAVHLEGNRLILATTQYPRFPGFSERVFDILTKLQSYFKPKHLSRVGLRYNDAVVPEPGEDIGQYLESSFLPCSRLAGEGHALRQHLTETMLSTPGGLLIVRALLGIHGMSVMPDLKGRFGLGSPIEVPNDRPSAVLDFDHYWTAQSTRKFSLEEAKSRLDALHEHARQAFWDTTTTYAREQKWQPETR